MRLYDEPEHLKACGNVPSKSQPIVIGLTGLASSGKSTVANYMEKTWGFDFLVFSDVLKAEAKKRGLLKGGDMESQKAILSKLGDDWRRETGKNDIIAEKLIEHIKHDGLLRVAVDGFRAPAEVELFKRSFERFNLIAIEVGQNVRFARRKEQDPAAKLEQIEARDKKDIEQKGLGKVITMADFLINNSGTKEELFKKVEEVVKPLLSTGRQNR
jgi:dephospho-CoA kinase